MKIKIIGFLIAIGIISSCQQEIGVRLDLEAKPYEKLSDYQFFEGDLKDLKPSENVLPYDLNTPLFSDHSKKARFVWMPDGESADLTKDVVLDFPKGAVLIKNFYYNHDERDLAKGRRIIETRLLVNKGDKWDAISYVWNDEQTEAYYDVVGDITKVEWTDENGTTQKLDYIIPNKNQCKGCHSYDGKLLPIGPKVRNLNKEYSYETGAMNQLEKWHSMGYIKEISDVAALDKVPTWNDPNAGTLHNRAMGYLDMNCGHCHNPHGPANTSGLNLIYTEPISLTLGVRKPPVATGKGSGGHSFSIYPGHPEKSILVYRMKATDPGARMPELGRTTVHEEGVELIEEWVASLEGH